MNIAKIHVWKVPVLLYGDLADRVLIYIHGQGGRKEEAESFAEIATNYGWQVISVDLPEHGERKDKARFVPWEVIPELQKIMKSAKENWKVIGIYACSIGAYFSVQAFQNTKPDICLLVSPVLDMEDMISNMMLQAQVTEEQLKERQEIKTETGVVLSWKYLCWVREHPVKSICKETNILYGTQDEIIPYKIVKKFSEENNCRLNFVENGHHWLHTDREVAAMRKWEQTVLEESRSIIPNK